MSLTTAQQDAYNKIIQTWYAGALPSSPSQITDAVASDVDQMLDSVIQCSKELDFTVSLTNLLFPAGGAIAFTKEVVKTGVDALLRWYDTAQNNKVSLACLNSGLLNWKDQIAMDLMGI